MQKIGDHVGSSIGGRGGEKNWAQKKIANNAYGERNASKKRKEREEKNRCMSAQCTTKKKG